jgi:hypothetical protein
LEADEFALAFAAFAFGFSGLFFATEATTPFISVVKSSRRGALGFVSLTLTLYIVGR